MDQWMVRRREAADGDFSAFSCVHFWIEDGSGAAVAEHVFFFQAVNKRCASSTQKW
jgi:hypothetical protein